MASKVRRVIRALLDDGWYLDEVEGDHRQYKHPTKPGKVTVAGHPNDDVPAGTLGNIRRQSGLSRKELP